MWALYKCNQPAYVFGDPTPYIFVNEHGIFVYALKIKNWIPVPDFQVKDWMNALFEADRVSELEALIVYGLHDGNANDIGYEMVKKEEEMKCQKCGRPISEKDRRPVCWACIEPTPTPRDNKWANVIFFIYLLFGLFLLIFGPKIFGC